MEAKDLKAIIEQVLQEMNVSSDEKAAAAEASSEHRHRQQKCSRI